MISLRISKTNLTKRNEPEESSEGLFRKGKNQAMNYTYCYLLVATELVEQNKKYESDWTIKKQKLNEFCFYRLIAKSVFFQNAL